MASPDVPAAEGEVRLGNAENQNTLLELHVKHLALPEKVRPDAKTYIVWTRASASEAQPQNLGALQVDDERNGRIKAITPLKKFEIFITAETSPLVTQPTGQRLLWTTVEL